jgi:hypothetical protein
VTTHPQRYEKARARNRERQTTLRAALPADSETLQQLYRAERGNARWRRLYRDLQAIGATKTKRGTWELPQTK